MLKQNIEIGLIDNRKKIKHLTSKHSDNVGHFKTYLPQNVNNSPGLNIDKRKNFFRKRTKNQRRNFHQYKKTHTSRSLHIVVERELIFRTLKTNLESTLRPTYLVVVLQQRNGYYVSIQ